MDISTGINNFLEKRSNRFSALVNNIRNFITKWLFGFFTLTEEERLEAGIAVDKENRDDKIG
jgi:hypothetical protein